VVPEADVVVGHSLGGLTIPLVRAAHRVYLSAFVPVWGRPVRALFAEQPLQLGFPDEGITRDERGRTVWVDEEFAISSMYADCELPDALAAYARLRPQAGSIYGGDYPLTRRPRGRSTYVLGSVDRAIAAGWARRAAAKRLGVRPLEIAAGHSPMLSRPSDLANLLDALATGAPGG
jgi:hypothetical protein